MNEPVEVESNYSQTSRRSMGQSSPFFAALSYEEIRGTQCVDCGRSFVPPRLRCPVDKAETNWVTIAGRGTVVGLTHLARRPIHAASGPEDLMLGLVQLDGVSTATLAELIGPVDGPGQRVVAKYREAPAHPLQQLVFEAEATPEHNREDDET